MPHVTQELVGKAYDALASGNRDEINKYWDQDMRWLVPGHNPLSGWYHGLDAFLAFMGQVGQLSANSFVMHSVAVMVSDEYSADVTHNLGFRSGYEYTGTVPYGKLDIDVVHVLRWRDGKVIEGRGAIFGDGTTEYDQFWGPHAERSGERSGHVPKKHKTNKDIVREAIEKVWNTGDKKAAEKYVAANYVFFQEGGGVALGIDRFKEWLDVIHKGFPDVKYTIDAMYAEGSKVATRYTITGTHTGDFRGLPPTNKPVKLTGHYIHRILDGKLVEAWGQWDLVGLLQQLGILPKFGPPGR